jgi:hypothetical protein
MDPRKLNPFDCNHNCYSCKPHPSGVDLHHHQNFQISVHIHRMILMSHSLPDYFEEPHLRTDLLTFEATSSFTVFALLVNGKSDC